jgi:hypothetical protein
VPALDSAVEVGELRVMAEPVRARRLTDQEGRRLLQIVRRGKHGSVRVRRAMIIMASASGTLVPAIARPPVRHHKPCGSRAGTEHNLTKRAGVPASRHRLASDGASWLACQK